MTGIEVKPPKTVWQRDVKFDWAPLVSALGKLAVDGGTANWAEAGKTAIDVAAAIGLARTAEEQAWLLISRALMRAVVELIAPYQKDFPVEPVDFEKEIKGSLTTLEMTIDDRFLANPAELEIVKEFGVLVERWLNLVNLRGRTAATIVARLPAHFVYALHQERGDHRDEYDRLFAELDTEFSAAWQRERSWLEYHNWFARDLQSPLFDEDFGLAQIFLWPRAYFVDTVDDQSSRARGPREPAAKPCHVVDLHSALDHWLAAESRADTIRVISGDPGAGKSSFARMYAAHRITKGDRVLLIPLKTLDVAGDLIENVTRLCGTTPPYPNGPFEDGAKPLLLILDGLDELAKQGQIGTRLALDFARHVQTVVTSRNQGSLHLRVLLCGRPIAVHDTESEFRATGQVLHLLPYVMSSESKSARTWVDPDGKLAADQRGEWWRKYGELTGTGHTGLPKELAGDALIETTGQPLLGYLLALVHRDANAKGETFSDVTRNTIYRRLIKAVYERDYNKPFAGHTASRDVTLEQFERLLAQMALAAWHEDTRVVRVAAVKQLCENSGQAALLDEYAQAAQGGVAQLFTAFYFRRQGSRSASEETFEFTHKSFAEYLVARRFVSELVNAADDLADRDASAKDRRPRGKTEDEILLDWLGVFGPTAITPDLIEYLETEVRLAGIDVAKCWQATLIRLINRMLREGMPCERVTPSLRFVEMMHWARNAEWALLRMLRSCSEVTEAISKIDWPSTAASGDWVRWLKTQKGGGKGLPLSRVGLAGQVLECADLTNADLRHADLTDAYLTDADLTNADLMYADLTNANLTDADLTDADLMYASLMYAGLMYADLTSADLRHADLMYADLMYADLMYANLTNADLRHASLMYADLRHASLTDADLTDADLANADLRGANVTPEQLAMTRGIPAPMPTTTT